MSPEAAGTGPGDDGHADDQAPDDRVGAVEVDAVEVDAVEVDAVEVDAVEVDARGRRCPLPVIALARAAQGLGAGSVLTLLATDPATRHDVPAWCRMRGHVLVSAPAVQSPEPPSPAVLRFVVRVGPPTPS